MTLPPKIEHYAALMGVHPTRVTITGARTRFGSCSGRNAISFSWRLMQYPEEAIDYVVVHELAQSVTTTTRRPLPLHRLRHALTEARAPLLRQ